MTTVTATATLAPTCEARTGFAPGEWEPMPLWCSTRIGLTVWTDRAGQTHRACRHHVAGLRYRYPEATVPECYRCHRSIPKGSEEDELAVMVSLGGRLALKCFRCQDKDVVIEDHDGYVVTADVE